MAANLRKTSTTIVYIMGTGRSGTTILEVMLSASDEACSVGELTHIFRDGFGQNSVCACGRPFDHCELWGQVEKRLLYSALRVRQAAALFKDIDWHKGFLKLIFCSISPKKLDSYTRTNMELYKAVSDVSDKKVIVDSSKYPARALMLNRIYGKAVKTICLTRSPAGLLCAFTKTGIEQPAKPAFLTLVYYAYVLLCCRVVSVLGRNVLFLTFEELSAFPVETIKKIENFTGLTFEPAKRKILNDQAFKPGHIITGNRIRKNRAVFFQGRAKARYAVEAKHKPVLLLMMAFQKLFGFKMKGYETDER